MKKIEDCIFNLAKRENTKSIDQLDINTISNIFNIEFIFWEFSSELVQYKSKYKVFINKESNCSRQWQDFGHEMYHYFIDHVEYDLLSRSYAYYSETKADYFAYHFCVPTFMLRKFNNLDVYDVMYYFNVEFDFALKRIEMYKNSLCYMK